MSEEIKKTSEEWLRERENIIKIIDPDGWDRSNYQYSFYEELITKEEFDKRLLMSTCESRGYDYILVTEWEAEGLQKLILAGNKEKTLECAREHFGEEYIIHGTEKNMNKNDYNNLPEWQG